MGFPTMSVALKITVILAYAIQFYNHTLFFVPTFQLYIAISL